MSKVRVMDDLDALLADLQTTTSHIAYDHPGDGNVDGRGAPRPSTPPLDRPHNAVPVATSTPLTHIISRYSANTDESSRESTPPPVPPHPAAELLKPLQQTHVSATHQCAKPTPPPKPAVASKPEKSSALGANLSELDALLQDLSNAQFLDEVDQKNAVNLSQRLSNPRTSSTGVESQGRGIDGLLVDLEQSMSPATNQQYSANNNAYKEESLYEAINPVNQSPGGGRGNIMQQSQPQVQASAATAELDDLMTSLSRFKMAPSSGPEHVGEPPYAMPNKGKAYRSPQPVPNAATASNMPSSPAVGTQDGTGPEELSHDSKALEKMLGNLSTDMSRQGISTVAKGHCAACMKPIVGQVITALGKIWHPEHFACAHCNNELGTQNFYEREGLPYCEKDYHQLFSPKCAACNGPILDKCVTAFDASWHPEHFTCTHCSRALGDDGFHEKDGKAYCREDYFELFAPKCGRCSGPIMDNYISALNRQWHPECFVCMECYQPFGTGSFFDHEGMPYCETHYHAKRGSLCASCNKPITGRCITAMYKKFHPEHFLCAFCLKQLNKGTFKEQNDKPYCDHCFNKLFG